MLLDSLVPWRARPNFRLDLMASVFGGLWVGGIFPFIGLIAREELKASDLELGMIAAAPFIGSFFALPFTHALSRSNIVRNVAFTLGFARMFIFVAAFTSSSLMFSTCITLMHVIASVTGPSAAAVLRLIYPADYLGRILSYTRALLALGTVLTTLLAGVLMDNFSWRYVLIGFAPLGVLSMVVYSRIRIPMGDPPPETAGSLAFMKSSLSLLKTDVPFRFFALAVFVYGFGNLMVMPVYTMYQVDVLRITPTWLGIISIVVQATWMVSYVFWGRFIDHVSPLKIVLINTLLASLMPLNYLFATEVWMLLPMAVVTGIVAAGIELSYFNSVMKFATPATAVQYQSMHSLLLGVRGAIAPFVGAAMAGGLRSIGGDIRWVFLTGAVLVLCSAVLQKMCINMPSQAALSREATV